MESLPLASPYPWTDSEPQSARLLTKKRRGSGLSYLQNKHLSSNKAKRLLDSLLLDHVESNPEPQDTNHLQTSVFFDSQQQQRSTIPQVAPDDATDTTIMHMAQDGGLSLLLSILKQVDTGSSRNDDNDSNVTTTGVSTRSIIRHCALVVNPSTTPGRLDAKDMVLAALLLLSSHATLGGNDDDYGDDDDDEDDHPSMSMIALPLIEAENPQDDAEKRVYRKVSNNWSSWTDFQQLDTHSNNCLLSELEVLFLASNPVTRERFVPRHLPDDELPLLQKGLIPPSALPKRKGPAPGYRRNKTIVPAL
eukprot:CAMPEP_0119005720 /NCGR_PEP_ID=MMETSP1176-20130426/1892_1 /TAXON_ID=265551 /ORGANISM="Synedropsis recta cf, Strain CCMP1620" /LENGTH=305 /DNA_ID=CAMNT_0006957561 /DNA_START=1 /DNA_END=918 /DNA_ORIENTATION=+